MNAHNNSNPLSQHEDNLNSLDDQLRLHLDEVATQVKAQELAKMIGKDDFDRIIQFWFKLNFAQSTALPSVTQYRFSPCPFPVKAFSFKDVLHSCRKCCNFTNEILEKIKNMGIKVDDELRKLVETEPQSVVEDAVEAYEEALKQRRVKYHESFLKAAIRKRYAPNYHKGIAA
ncbi:hypothetical protein NIES2101_38100 [Calothrix sp. HK-06]|nr:hypothetical protein NIES2101_38100 [Calothrix sp. HK-06]